MKLLSIIIVSFNSYDILCKCLEKTLTSDLFDIFIIDNASTDNSYKNLIIKFPHINIINLEQNIGYGRAANIGILKATTPFALLLNPDILATPTEVNKLLGHALNSRDNTAIWAPVTDLSIPKNLSPQKTDWVSGCAMLFDVAKIKKIGLFDENIFLYFEETDICQRTIKSGFSISLCNDIHFKHLVGKACQINADIDYMKNWHYGWSSAYFYTKHKLDFGKKNTKRRFLIYKIKSLLAKNPIKRKAYKANSDGILAYLNGKKAFNSDGTPAALFK